VFYQAYINYTLYSDLLQSIGRDVDVIVTTNVVTFLTKKFFRLQSNVFCV